MKLVTMEVNSPNSAMKALRKALGENLAVIVNDALHCYALHPEMWGYDNELDDILILIRACDKAGLNTVLERYDVSKNKYLQCLYREFRQLPGNITFDQVVACMAMNIAALREEGASNE